MEQKKPEKIGLNEWLLILVLIFVVVACVVALLGDKINLIIPGILAWLRSLGVH